MQRNILFPRAFWSEMEMEKLREADLDSSLDTGEPSESLNAESLKALKKKITDDIQSGRIFAWLKDFT